MPIFDYTCEHCNYRFDKLVLNLSTKVNCPLCQGKVKKLPSSFSVGTPHNVTGSFPKAPGTKMCTNC